MMMSPGSRSNKLLLIAVLMFCIGLAGCLPPVTNLAPVIVLEVTPSEGYMPLHVMFDASQSFDPEGRTLTIHWDFGDGETATGSTAAHSFQRAGNYQAQVTVLDPDGEATTEIVLINVLSIPDGYMLRRFEWERDREPRVWELLIPFQLYQYYRGQLRIPFINNFRYDDYVNAPLDDPTIKDYATELLNRVGGNRDDFIHEALSFVQGAIRYQADPPGTDHPLYPLETLADGYGDCEDTAILFVSLLQALNIPSKLAFVDTNNDRTPDHVLAFVAVSSSMLASLACPGQITVFEWDNRIFVLAETAVDQGVFPLGCDPWGLEEGDLAKLWSFPHP